MKIRLTAWDGDTIIDCTDLDCIDLMGDDVDWFIKDWTSKYVNDSGFKLTVERIFWSYCIIK